MKLSEFLDRSGWSKADVARRFQISPPAVSLWDEIPGKYRKRTDQILAEGFPPPKPVKQVELSDEELLKVIRTRGKVSDWDICQERGWRVWEFNQMIADLVKKYPVGHEFWGV